MCFDYEIEKKERIKRDITINEDTDICPESDKIEEYTIRHQRIIDSEMAPSRYLIKQILYFSIK
jgi:hypothetical protein